MFQDQKKINNVMSFLKQKIAEIKLKKKIKSLCSDVGRLIQMRGDLIPNETIVNLRISSKTLKNISKKLGLLRKPKTSEELCNITKEADNLSRLVDELTPPSLKNPMYAILDTLLVAFGVAMAFRAYFFQPFKIPTGSMQPTFYGVHSEYVSPEQVSFYDKTPVFKQMKWLITGASYIDVVAKKDCFAEFYTDSRYPGFVVVKLGEDIYKIPQDSFDRGEIKNLEVFDRMADNPHDTLKPKLLGSVRAGTRLWSGYVHSGDQVFANRMAWNFFPPERDDTMIFTTSVPEIEFAMPSTKENTFPFPFVVKDEPIQPGLMAGQHYIKRLVGMPNETISIADGRIVADGKSIEGLPGMDRISRGEDGYRPYRVVSVSNPPKDNQNYKFDGALVYEGDEVKLEDEYMALGDNTSNSYDSRFWGPVPRRAMVGPAAFVWWPFTDRWGFVD